MSEIDEIRRKIIKDMIKEKKFDDKPITLTDKNFDEIIKKYPVIVVDFWAPWCGPCKFFSPIFEEVAKEMKGRAIFGKVNTDENEKLCERFGIMSIPTVLILKNGEIINRNVGAMPADMLKEWIENNL
ncbi:MAG: thioredoxin [Thermoplasmatales archaeon]|nr:thioredoxin [Thermoplasmatales archaeon]